MYEANTVACRNRGRPSSHTDRHVIQDLMSAADTVLKSKTVKETTTREIAATAGTNEAMINYYFGSKEGLMIALLDETLKRHPNRHPEDIAASCIEQSSIRPLVEELASFYDAQPSLVRMVLSEVISGSSKIKFLFDRKYAADTPKCIIHVVRSMVDAGLYSSDLHIELTAMSIMSMIVGPNFLRPFSDGWEATEKFSNPEWINHVVRTIDRSARATAH